MVKGEGCEGVRGGRGGGRDDVPGDGLICDNCTASSISSSLKPKKMSNFFSPCKIILSLTFFSEEGSLLFQRAAHNSGIV